MPAWRSESQMYSYTCNSSSFNPMTGGGSGDATSTVLDDLTLDAPTAGSAVEKSGFELMRALWFRDQAAMDEPKIVGSRGRFQTPGG